MQKRYLTIFSSLLLVGVFFWLIFIKGPLGPTKVTVTKAKTEPLTASVFGIGTVEARLSYAIGPAQAGRVLNVKVDQGDKVLAGQILGEIDPVDLDQRIQSAAAGVSRARSAVMVSEAQVRDVSSRNTLAQTSAKRYLSLFSANAISRELVDAKQAEANSTLASLDAARATLSAVQDDLSRATSDYNALLSQRANLQLISPTDGIVVSRDAEPGTTVVAGQSVFHVIDPKTLWVRTRIDQSRFYGITVGQSAQIALRSRPDTPITGKVGRLEVQGDNVTEERFVNVSFSEIPGLIPLGELAEVTIDLPSVSSALTVPAAAIKRINKSYGVWILENDQLRFQTVTIGAQSAAGRTQILSGLKPGDIVVVYSPKLLTEGMKVRAERLAND